MEKMHNFRVPPSPAWYTHAVSTPDNGLLYITGNHTSIAHISLSQENTDSKVKIIHTHNQ